MSNKFCDQYIVEIVVTILADPRKITLEGHTFVDQDGNEYSPVVTWERHGNGDRKPSPINRLALEESGLNPFESGWEAHLQAISNPVHYIRQFWNLDALPDQVYTSDGIELAQKTLPDGTVIYYAEIVNGEVIDHISYGISDLADRLQEYPTDFLLERPTRKLILLTYSPA
jgi:hypothetical protein